MISLWKKIISIFLNIFLKDLKKKFKLTLYQEYLERFNIAFAYACFITWPFQSGMMQCPNKKWRCVHLYFWLSSLPYILLLIFLLIKCPMRNIRYVRYKTKCSFSFVSEPRYKMEITFYYYDLQKKKIIIFKSNQIITT